MYYKALLEPGQIGTMKLKNRVFFPPMGTNLIENGFVTDELIAYHSRRAQGGVAMCIIEATSVHITSSGNHILSVDDDKYLPGLTRLASAIKENGARACMQLSHYGRQHPGEAFGGQPWGPSPIPCPYIGEMPHEMTVDEIHEVIESFADAARRVKQAGFDALEIHAGHGYLLDSFLNANSNQRTDSYGGDLKQRAKFPLEVIAAVREAVGQDFPILIRMSVQENVPNGITAEEGVQVATWYERAGVNAIDVTQGCYGAFEYTVPPYYLPDKVNAGLAEMVRKAVHIPVVVAGNIHSPDLAKSVLEDGMADFISMGRVHLADPDFMTKVQEDRPCDILRCISCDSGCAERYFTGTVSCVFNPEAGFETQRVLKEAEKAKNVVVIGGGPAGLEAATIAARRGHHVVLLEKSGELGGQYIIAGRAPHKRYAEMNARYMGYQAMRSGVDVRLYTSASEERVKALNPDVIIVATGSAPFIPRIDGIHGENVYEARALINGEVRIKENEICVIGGGIVGMEAADFLCEQGKQVSIIEMMDTIGAQLEEYVKPYMKRVLEENHVKQYTKTKCTEITKDCVKAEQKGDPISIPTQAVVVAVGGRSDADHIYDMVKDLAPECYVIGDAKKVGKVIEAIWQGYEVAASI